MLTRNYRFLEDNKIPDNIKCFVKEINDVCKKYNLSIVAEEPYTSFVIEKYNDINDERDIMIGKHCGHGL